MIATQNLNLFSKETNTKHIKITIKLNEEKIKEIIFHEYIAYPLIYIFLKPGVFFINSAFKINRTLRTDIKKIISPYQPTYEDVDNLYKNGKGYFENLSKKEQDFFFTKEENLPLGL